MRANASPASVAATAAWGVEVDTMSERTRTRGARRGHDGVLLAAVLVIGPVIPLFGAATAVVMDRLRQPSTTARRRVLSR
jgi:hypothetical protein